MPECSLLCWIMILFRTYHDHIDLVNLSPMWDYKLTRDINAQPQENSLIFVTIRKILWLLMSTLWPLIFSHQLHPPPPLFSYPLYINNYMNHDEGAWEREERRSWWEERSFRFIISNHVNICLVRSSLSRPPSNTKRSTSLTFNIFNFAITNINRFTI